MLVLGHPARYAATGCILRTRTRGGVRELFPRRRADRQWLGGQYRARIGGGRISAAECQMALAFGVRTAFVEEADAAVGRGLAELNWLVHPQLRRDISEAKALQQFVDNEV